MIIILLLRRSILVSESADIDRFTSAYRGPQIYVLAYASTPKGYGFIKFKISSSSTAPVEKNTPPEKKTGWTSSSENAHHLGLDCGICCWVAWPKLAQKKRFFPQTLVVAIIGMDRMVCTADRISKTTFDCLLPVVFRRSVQSSTQIASFTECTLVVFRTLWQSAIVQD